MSSASRSMDATDEAAVRAVERRRVASPNGMWGMYLLIATEATLLLSMVGTYHYLRFENAQWPPPPIEPPSVVLPLVMLAVLLTTTVPMLLAAAAARAGRLNTTRTMLLGATLLQGGYLAVQILLLISDLNDFRPQDSAYASIYYAMTVTHHAHVVIGLLLSVGLQLKLLGGLTNYRVIGVRAVAAYWVFVNVLAIPVVLSQLWPSL